MCGFAGILNFTDPLEITDELRSYSKLLHHRGPDAEGFYQDQEVALCHRRLSIIDLNSSSDQPFISECNRFILCYNGELYNYLELRSELIELGHDFKTKSDTEVFLTGFIQWGNEFFTKTNGMFAASIWDKNKSKLTLVRDRLGIKPLYISKIDKEIYFSSEIRPILHSRKITKLNYKSIQDYFKYRYITGNQTAFKDINCVPPGYYIEIVDGQITQNSYWELSSKVSNKKANYHKIKDILIKAVSLRLRADTPISSFLSGGIDSSAILHIARNHLPSKKEIDTYTYETSDKSSETTQASNFAREQGCSNTIVHKKSNYSDLRKIIYSLEEPIGDNIVLASYDLSHEISKKHKVALSGEGADEIFNGYAHHHTLYLISKYHKVLKPLTSLLKYIPISIVNLLHPYPRKLDKEVIKKITSKVKSFDGTNNSSNNFISLFDDDELKKYLSPEFEKKIKKVTTIEEEGNYLNKMTIYDLKNWTTKYTLLRCDKINMANSLEVRVPFLDHNLVSAILILKDKYRIGLFTQKIALRSAMKLTSLKKNIVNRKKSPFLISYNEELQIACKERFLSKCRVESYFWNEENVKRLVTKADKRSFIENKQLFSILYFDIWFEVFEEQGLTL